MNERNGFLDVDTESTQTEYSNKEELNNHQTVVDRITKVDYTQKYVTIFQSVSQEIRLILRIKKHSKHKQKQVGSVHRISQNVRS